MPYRTGLLVIAAAMLAPSAPAEAPQRLDPVEVYGDRPEQAPGSRAILDAQLIADTAADRPAEILNQAPAVNIQMNSGQEHLISIRSPVLTGGAGQGSFLILENGVPIRSPAFGNVNSLIEPHHEVADAIEIVRGPASAKYGSNAVHGLLNFILPDTSSAQSLRLSYTSLERLRGDASVNLGSATRLNLSLMDDAGWRDDTQSQQQKLSLVTQADFAGWDASFWLAASSLNQETASFIQGPRAYEDDALRETNPNPEAFRDAWSARLGGRLSRDVGPGTLTLLPNLHSQAMIFSQHFLPYGGVEKNGHTGGGVLARYEFTPTGPVRWRLGADTDFATGYLREIQPTPNPSPNFPQGIHYDYTVDTQVFALWAEADWQLTEGVRLLAGLRGETHAYDYTTDAPTGINGRFNVPENRTDDFTFLTPKLGLVWDQPWGALYANYARGARAPQVSDLYRLQNRQVAGEIDTETLDSLEIGARGSSFGGQLDFDIALWGMEKENFFFRDSDGLNVPDGSTRHIGIDVQAGWAFTDTLSAKGNVAWSEQTYTFNRPVVAARERITSGNLIDTAPQWLADARFDWQASDALRLSLTAEHVGEYFMDPANTARYPGHTVLGARAGYTLPGGLETFLIIRNLTDEKYADRADLGFGNERYFPGEPVNAVFGLTKTF
ncbi:TonB-dependent receptor [Hyphomonas sp.]|uniref:TonB-dependent receptor n=1 Tax=Hyphomonas sp. TaxID=87 RepID=UPI002632BE50|nr:TonB-dependent receptor [Hyphomonas sp.]